MVAKRLGLLHELVPKVVHVAVLVDPAVAVSAETTLREVHEAARVVGLQIHVFNASRSNEIDAAFATVAREPPDALFVAPDGLFASRLAQFVTLTARDRIPAVYAQREFVEVGGLMSYGTSFPDVYRQVGVYTGNILKGAKPADLPVMQSTTTTLHFTGISRGDQVPPQFAPCPGGRTKPLSVVPPLGPIS
jgi:putative ABC transport system substrate-binding protein